MPVEHITSRQAIFYLTLFIFGSSIVIGINSELGQDSWIVLLTAMVLSLPLLMIYARIMKLFPEMDFFTAMEQLFGKVLGKVITVLICIYAVHLGALVLRNFSEFIQIVMMPETPKTPIAIMMVLTVTYLVKSGIETTSKWSIFSVIFIYSVLVFTFTVSTEEIDTQNLLPVMDHTVGEVAGSAAKVISFPFAESVLFITMTGAIRKKDSPYKIFFWSVILASICFFFVIIRNIMVLGAPMIKTEFFSSYITARILHIGDWLSRIEGTITINFILSGIAKVTLCVFAASKGMARLFGTRDYRQMTIPAVMIMLAFSSIVYINAMDMFAFLNYYPYYAFPFQVIIPVIIWITAEIRTHRGKKPLPQPPAPNQRYGQSGGDNPPDENQNAGGNGPEGAPAAPAQEGAGAS